MIDLRYPWMVLALRVSWAAIEAALVHKRRSGRRWETGEMFGPSVQVVGAGVSAAGCPRLLRRLMTFLLCLKYGVTLSDKKLVKRWAKSDVRRKLGAVANGSEEVLQRLNLIMQRTERIRTRQRRWLKRRQAIESIIGHLKADHRMNWCWLAGSLGDTIHAVLCAAGYNLRWLLRAIAAGRIRRLFYVLCLAVLQLVLIVFGILILDRQWLTRLAVTTG